MRDLEFQRELSPEQIREALSLLDRKAEAQNHNLRVGDLTPAEKADPERNQSSTTVTTQDNALAAENLQVRKQHLNVAVAYYGVCIVAAGALTLWSWSHSAHAPPPLPGIAHDQLPKHRAAPLTRSASPALPAANRLPDEIRGGSARQASMPEVAGSSTFGYTTRDDDQIAVNDAANTDSAIPSAAPSATIPAIGMGQARWEEPASRKPEQAWWHARTVPVIAAKKRFWRHHWQARTEIHGGERCSFACLSWRAQRVFYEPPRSVTQ